MVKARHTFPPEVLDFFARLEDTPRRLRRAQWFQEAEEDLHRKLGVGFEWLCSGAGGGANVLDRASSPRYIDPGSPQAEYWHACHRVRLALLEALGRAGPEGSAKGRRSPARASN